MQVQSALYSTFIAIHHLRNKKKTGASQLSQGLLGLLPGISQWLTGTSPVTIPGKIMGSISAQFSSCFKKGKMKSCNLSILTAFIEVAVL